MVRVLRRSGSRGGASGDALPLSKRGEDKAGSMRRGMKGLENGQERAV